MSEKHKRIKFKSPYNWGKDRFKTKGDIRKEIIIKLFNNLNYKSKQ